MRFSVQDRGKMRPAQTFRTFAEAKQYARNNVRSSFFPHAMRVTSTLTGATLAWATADGRWVLTDNS